jgi:hypothetical protein
MFLFFCRQKYNSLFAYYWHYPLNDCIILKFPIIFLLFSRNNSESHNKEMAETIREFTTLTDMQNQVPIKDAITCAPTCT